jgi:Ca-activated chloride channel family protein
MRARLTLALLAVVLPATLHSQQAQTPIFRTATETVSVFATVIGKDGRLVTHLTRDQFIVSDNGDPQPLTIFDAAAKPIHLIVLLDASGSMTGNLPVLRQAAVQLFTRLRQDDRARVGYFGYRIQISPSFTNNVDELIRSLWMAVEQGGPTPLWRALTSAIIALAPIDGRRVVLVLTDGKDNQSKQVGGYQLGPTLDDVIAHAHREDVMVYAIGMRSLDQTAAQAGEIGRSADAARAGPDPGLKVLAAETGGGYFELSGTENLSDVFASVADELHHQYLLGYALPEADGKQHRVEVTLPDRDLDVRARQRYLAPRAGSGR